MLLYRSDQVFSQSSFICLQCGVVLGTFLLVASSYASKKSCNLLLRSAQISRKQGFESLGKLVYLSWILWIKSPKNCMLLISGPKLTTACDLFTGFHVGGFLGKFIVEMRYYESYSNLG